jgi:hypothetical protein
VAWRFRWGNTVLSFLEKVEIPLVKRASSQVIGGRPPIEARKEMTEFIKEKIQTLAGIFPFPRYSFTYSLGPGGASSRISYL